MGSDLLMLYKLDDDSKYLNLAAELAEHLKESLITVGDSEYVWPYWSGKSEAGWSAGEDLSVNTPSRGPQSYLEDISHGGVDLSFMEDCYDNHFVFNRTDMNRFVGTFQGIVDRNTFLAPDLTRKSSNPDEAAHYGSALNGWLRLCRFDKGIYWSFYTIFYQNSKPTRDLEGRLFLLASLIEYWPG